MPGKLLIYATLMFSLLISQPGPAMAGSPSHAEWHSAYRLAAKQGVSLDQAVAQVQRDTQGRILTAETINRNGRAVHRIKVLLPNGNVRVVYVEAE